MILRIFLLLTASVALPTGYSFLCCISKKISSVSAGRNRPSKAPSPASLLLLAKRTNKNRRGGQSAKSYKILKRIALDLEEYTSQKQNNAETWIVTAIRDLSLAKTKMERQRIAHWLVHRANFQHYPKYLELAIQAMALSGQIDSAMSKFNLQTAKNETTFMSIVDGMRFSRRIDELKEFLKRWNTERSIIEPSERMLNAFLSAQPSLDHMYREIQAAPKSYGVEPNAMSYSIVLQEAAKRGNRSMVTQVWGEMKKANVVPVIECYNALLRMAETPKEILFLWDTKIKAQEGIQPDPYTIEHILVPMVKSGRLSELLRVLDEYVASSHPYAVSNAFTPFLIRLARDGGEIDTARLIWEKYMFGGRLKPTIRHFNVLLGCYCSLLKDTMNSTALEDVYEAGWGLYQTLTWDAIRPDVITLVEMMKFCRSSDELSEFFLTSLVTYRFRVTETLFRSAITAYGKLGDPSSALWLFDKKSPDNLKSWNTLLGCLIKVPSCDSVLKPSDSNLAKRYERKGMVGKSSLDSEDASVMILRECTLQAKIEEIFQYMLSEATVDSQTFCLMALDLQRQGNPSIESARKLYDDATGVGVHPDGRFLNGILRCFGPNIKEAVDVWKNQMRPQILSFYEKNNKELLLNLSAAYFGVFYVCGRALRPDVALRLAYAMGKDGLEPDDRCLNTYRTGRREYGTISTMKGKLLEIHESLFEVECSKLRNSWQLRDDRKVRVILSPQADYDLP